MNQDVAGREMEEMLKARVPERLRIGVVVFGVANIALLVAAHICTGAITRVDGQAPFGQLHPHIASQDNLLSAVARLAGANAWALAFVVAIMSGLWPYIKLLNTIAVVHITHRGAMMRESAQTALALLEALGKWSFADVFLLCVNMTIFNIDTPVHHLRLIGSLQVTMWMEPRFGAVALVIAIIGSALVTHWAAWELSSQQAVADEGTPILDGQAQAEAGQRLAEPIVASNPRLRGLTRTFGICLPILAAVLLVLGCAVPMMKVARSGFLGNMLRASAGDPPDSVKLSVFSMVHSMLAVPDPRGGVATGFFAVVVFVLAFVVPLLELLLLAVSSALPEGLRRRRSIAVASWCHSIDCMEVVLIAVLVTVWQLSRVVSFNIGNECAPFASIMNSRPLLTVAGVGFLASSDCFLAIATLGLGWWLLLGSVALRTGAWFASGHGLLKAH